MSGIELEGYFTNNVSSKLVHVFARRYDLYNDFVLKSSYSYVSL